VTSAVKNRLTRRWAASYAQNKDKRDLSLNVTTMCLRSAQLDSPWTPYWGQPRYSVTPHGCENGQDGKTAASFRRIAV
jgi:hypothetical protein